MPFDDHQAGRLPADLAQPDLAAFDPRRVILRHRVRRSAEEFGIGPIGGGCQRRDRLQIIG